MSSQLPPPPQPNQEPTASAWWPIGRWGNTQRAVGFIGAALVIVGLLALGTQVNQSEDEKDERSPSAGTELCALLRDPDPDSRRLTRGDLERLTDWTDWELQRYVRSRCPDQYDRVD